MNKLRLRFTKTGRAIYISHLDLLHTIQRSFSRAGLPLAHSEGFNPHPATSIALPLSLGHESMCEILDFKLVPEFSTELSNITDSLNNALPDGIEIIETYEPIRKIKELKYLKVLGLLEFDSKIIDCSLLADFFSKNEIIISKRSKKGPVDFDIKKAIKDLYFTNFSSAGLSSTVELCAVISAQDPTLNPELLIDAIKQYIPECLPDFDKFKRIEVFDENMKVFR